MYSTKKYNINYYNKDLINELESAIRISKVSKKTKNRQRAMRRALAKLSTDLVYYFLYYLRPKSVWFQDELIGEYIEKISKRFIEREVSALVVQVKIGKTSRLILETIDNMGKFEIIHFTRTNYEELYDKHCGITIDSSLNQYKTVVLECYDKNCVPILSTNISPNPQMVTLVKYGFLVLYDKPYNLYGKSYHCYEGLKVPDILLYPMNSLVFVTLLIFGDLSKLKKITPIFPPHTDRTQYANIEIRDPSAYNDFLRTQFTLKPFNSMKDAVE